MLEFGKTLEILDIYHALENLSACSKALFAAESAELTALAGVLGYLTWHRDRLCYRERLFAGRAIGSGQVESACKNLIGARLKQTGARWSEFRVNRMGVVCSLAYGDQWDDYWKQAE